MFRHKESVVEKQNVSILVLASAYQSPSSDENKFFTKLNVIEILTRKHKNVIVDRDFNVSVLNSNCRYLSSISYL